MMPALENARRIGSVGNEDVRTSGLADLECPVHVEDRVGDAKDEAEVEEEDGLGRRGQMPSPRGKTMTKPSSRPRHLAQNVAEDAANDASDNEDEDEEMDDGEIHKEIRNENLEAAASQAKPSNGLRTTAICETEGPSAGSKLRKKSVLEVEKKRIKTLCATLSLMSSSAAQEQYGSFYGRPWIVNPAWGLRLTRDEAFARPCAMWWPAKFFGAMQGRAPCPRCRDPAAGAPFSQGHWVPPSMAREVISRRRTYLLVGRVYTCTGRGCGATYRNTTDDFLQACPELVRRLFGIIVRAKSAIDEDFARDLYRDWLVSPQRALDAAHREHLHFYKELERIYELSHKGGGRALEPLSHRPAAAAAPQQEEREQARPLQPAQGPESACIARSDSNASASAASSSSSSSTSSSLSSSVSSSISSPHPCACPTVSPERAVLESAAMKLHLWRVKKVVEKGFRKGHQQKLLNEGIKRVREVLTWTPEFVSQTSDHQVRQLLPKRGCQRGKGGELVRPVRLREFLNSCYRTVYKAWLKKSTALCGQVLFLEDVDRILGEKTRREAGTRKPDAEAPPLNLKRAAIGAPPATAAMAPLLKRSKVGLPPTADMFPAAKLHEGGEAKVEQKKGPEENAAAAGVAAEAIVPALGPFDDPEGYNGYLMDGSLLDAICRGLEGPKGAASSKSPPAVAANDPSGPGEELQSLAIAAEMHHQQQRVMPPAVLQEASERPWYLTVVAAAAAAAAGRAC